MSKFEESGRWWKSLTSCKQHDFIISYVGVWDSKIKLPHHIVKLIFDQEKKNDNLVSSYE